MTDTPPAIAAADVVAAVLNAKGYRARQGTRVMQDRIGVIGTRDTFDAAVAETKQMPVVRTLSLRVVPQWYGTSGVIRLLQPVQTRTSPWTPEEILVLFERRGRQGRRAVEHAILALYYCQTSEERAAKATTERNGMGYNGIDAELLTNFAQRIKVSVGKEGDRLTPGQAVIAYQRIQKYAKQLAFISNRRIR